MRKYEFQAPPSKLLTQCGLLFAAFAEGTSEIHNTLSCAETESLVPLLASFGADVQPTEDGTGYKVTGLGGAVGATAAVDTQDVPFDCDIGDSRILYTFLPSLLTAGHGVFRVHGSKLIQSIPLGELPWILTSLGAQFSFENQVTYAPFTLKSKGINLSAHPDGIVDIDCGLSSELLAALLVGAPLCGGLTIKIASNKFNSWQMIRLILLCMLRFGVRVKVMLLDSPNAGWKVFDWENSTVAPSGMLQFDIPAGPYKACDFTVESDWAITALLLAAGAAGAGQVRVTNISFGSAQGEIAILDILRQMGAKVAIQQDEICVSSGMLHGLQVDLGTTPALIPLVAGLAAHAGSATIINNLSLIQDAERLKKLEEQLGRIGCSVMLYDGGMIISPPAGKLRDNLAATVFETENDYRIVMGLCLLGFAGPGKEGGYVLPQFDDAECLNKAYPGFWEHWQTFK